MLPALPPFKNTSEELAAAGVFFALFGTLVTVLVGGGGEAALTGGGVGFGLWFAAWWIGLKEGTLL